VSSALLLVLFSAVVLAGAAWLAARDALLAGFYVFLFVYVIFALIGYALYPTLSIALGLYLGPGVVPRAVLFLALSFLGFLVTYAILGERIIHRGWIGVRYAAAPGARLALFGAIVLYLAWMAAVFARDYASISYANFPQMPDFAFSIGFKQMPVVSLVLYAFVRRHARTPFERIAGIALLIVEALLFAMIAGKAGNRSDILALSLGVVTYELFPVLTDDRGGLRPGRALQLARRPVVVALVALVGVAGGWLMLRNYAARGSLGAVEGLPTYAILLYNDFFTPAHMLFGAIGLDWVHPWAVIQSNLANATFTGRVFDVPYLQQDIGNALVPGTSNRMASFGYYLFAEGWMFAGAWGFLYNAIVPALGLLCWRRLSATRDLRANLFWAAFAAMFVATIARSQSALIPRSLLFNGVLAAVLFVLATGARAVRSASP